MTLIFDFNGTLVDDVELCFNLLNKLLNYKNHDSISFLRYKEIFRFPIIEYYKLAGFIFPEDNYEELSNMFVNDYKNVKPKLFSNVKETLKLLKEKHKLIVLSACELNLLTSQLKDLEIYDYFDLVLGNSDIYGKTKIDNALDYVKNHQDEEIYLIGDTDHDLFVANEIGAKCILVTYGHQNVKELNTGIINKFDDLLNYF